MDTRELSKIDLNLLISLQVMLEERNVSKAAARLYITQPAMSKTLSRLRRVFDDPLFTRSSHGMQPTPRAEHLAAQLGAVLTDITSLVSRASFTPRQFSGEITIALSEYIAVTLLPPLVQKLHLQAPQLSIRTITRVENQLEQLRLGNLDFAIQMKQHHYGDEFQVAELGGSPPAILVRESHPLRSGEISWQRLRQYPVIQLYISDPDQIEINTSSEVFSRFRHPDQGSLEISHLLTALEVLRSTDYYMPGPAYLMQNASAAQGIVGLPIPKGDNYSMNYVLVGHNRTANSALHQWLWDEITSTVREFKSSGLPKARQRVSAIPDSEGSV